MEPRSSIQHTYGLMKSLPLRLGKLQLLEDVMAFFQGLLMSGDGQCIQCIPDTLLCQMLFLPPLLWVGSPEKEVISTGLISAWLVVPSLSQ